MSGKDRLTRRGKLAIAGWLAAWAIVSASAEAMTALAGTGRVWALADVESRGRCLCFWTDAGWTPADISWPDGPDRSSMHVKRLHVTEDGSVLALWHIFQRSDEQAICVTRHKDEEVGFWGPTGLQQGVIYPDYYVMDADEDIWAAARQHVCRFSKAGEIETVREFSAEEYHPVQPAGSERRYLSSPRLFLDPSGRVWAWGESHPEWAGHTALRGLCRFSTTGAAYHPTVAGLPDRPFTALRRIAGSRYWVAVREEGLYELDLDKLEGRPAREPAPGVFRHVVHIEPIQDSVYVLTKTEGVPKVALWRFRHESWQRVTDSLPSRQEYSIVETSEGVWIAGQGAALEFIAEGQNAVTEIDWRHGFPLREVDALFRRPLGSLLATWYHHASPGLSTVLAVPEELLTPRAIASNVETLHVFRGIVQDVEGRLWTVLRDKPDAVSRWDGAPPWHSYPMPEGWRGDTCRALFVDLRSRIWLWRGDQEHAKDPPAAPVVIFDPSSETWTCHESLLDALVAQLNDPDGFGFAPGSPLRPIVSDHGRIAFGFGYQWKFYYYGMMSAEAKATLYTDDEYPPEMRTGMALTDAMDWHRFLYADFGGGTLADYYFDPSGRLIINTRPRGDRTTEPETWELDEQKGWRKLEYRPAPETTIPEEPLWKSAFVNAQPPSRGPVIRDALGLLWNWYGDDGQLYKRTIGASAPQFAPDEVHPFITGEPISEPFVDPQGNLFFRLSGEEYAMVKPRVPLPDTTVELTYDGIDDVTATMTSPVQGDVWYVWRLDGGDWSKPQKDAQVRLVNLAAGDHRFEAVALDKWLQPDYSPAVAAIRFEADLAEQIAGWITALSSADYDEREAAVKALINAGELALDALRKARTGVNADLCWWIDAAIEGIEKNP